MSPIKWFYALPLRLRSIFNRKKVEIELDEELKYHLDMQIEENVVKGMSPEEARRSALVSLGGMDQRKEECRDARGLRWAADLLKDCSFLFRSLRRSPGYAISIILILSLGIGVNVSSFAFMERVLLHPFSFPQLDRLMMVWESPIGMAETREGIAPAKYLALKERSRSYQFLGAYRGWDVNLTGDGDYESIQACLVTPDFFYVLGSKAFMGRTFQMNEGESEQARVVVVSHGFWRRILGGKPNTVGTMLSLNGASYTIVGVMPDSFNYPLETEIWIPLVFTAAQRHDRESRNLSLLGRLNPSVSIQQGRSEAHSIARQLAAEHPEVNDKRDIQVSPIGVMTNEVATRFILILHITAGFVLLLAIANASNLQLVRSVGRQREFAIRTVMGATRGMMVRFILAEAFLMSLATGGLGLYLAAWNLALYRWMIPVVAYKWVAGLKYIHIDTSVVLFTLVVSFISVLLCMAPALRHIPGSPASESINSALKENGLFGRTGRVGLHMRTFLAISEVILAVILLVGAGVMVRTFNALLVRNPGYDPANLLVIQITLAESRYTKAQQYSDFYSRILHGLDQMGSAQSAAVEAFLGYAQDLFIEGRPVQRSDRLLPQITSVSGGYFRTMRLPLIKGRPITDRDDNKFQPVMVISKSVARNYWPDSDPIGAHVRLSKSGTWITVVGVCGDVKDWFFSSPAPRAYVSFLQTPSAYASILVRTRTAPELAAAAARTEILKIDPAQPISSIKSMEQKITEQTSGVRASAMGMTAYALIAMFLAISGIYAVISYSVVQRTHEIGIRIALGAERAAVLRMTLAETGRVGAIGLGIGIPAAFGLICLLSSALYGVIQPNVATFVYITLIMGASALAAGYIPALRAARVDPIRALRNE